LVNFNNKVIFLLVLVVEDFVSTRIRSGTYIPVVYNSTYMYTYLHVDSWIPETSPSTSRQSRWNRSLKQPCRSEWMTRSINYVV